MLLRWRHVQIERTTAWSVKVALYEIIDVSSGEDWPSGHPRGHRPLTSSEGVRINCVSGQSVAQGHVKHLPREEKPQEPASIR